MFLVQTSVSENYGESCRGVMSHSCHPFLTTYNLKIKIHFSNTNVAFFFADRIIVASGVDAHPDTPRIASEVIDLNNPDVKCDPLQDLSRIFATGAHRGL